MFPQIAPCAGPLTALGNPPKAGLAWAEPMAAGTLSGRPRSSLDPIIAAIAAATDCVVVTDNERDFMGIEIVNPIGGAR